MRPTDPGLDDRFLAASGVSLELPLASPVSRGFAAAVDLLVLAALLGVVVAAGVVAYLVVGEVAEDAGVWVAVVGLVVAFGLQWGYFAGFEWAWAGQTPGKRMFGLRVVTDEGATPGAWHVVTRNLLRSVDLLPGAYGIGLLTALLSARGKRLGDLAAGTVVVREVPPPPSRSWPEGLDGVTVHLLEEWFQRAPGLVPERREALAREVVAAVERRRPGALEGLPEQDVAAALWRRFHGGDDGLR